MYNIFGGGELDIYTYIRHTSDWHPPVGGGINIPLPLTDANAIYSSLQSSKKRSAAIRHTVGDCLHGTTLAVYRDDCPRGTVPVFPFFAPSQSFCSSDVSFSSATAKRLLGPFKRK